MKEYSLSKTVFLFFSVLIMSLFVGIIVFAWTEPSTTPPGGNVSAPINIGSESQIKAGSLTVGGLTVDNSDFYMARQSVGTAGRAIVDRPDGIYFNYESDWAKGVFGSDLEIQGNIAPTGITLEGDTRSTWADIGGQWKVEGNVLMPVSAELDAVQIDKLTVNTIDPVFEIDGQNYATYVSDFAGGTRIETAGVVFIDQNYVIDFNDIEKGSNLWLFWKASSKDIDDLVVNLTCGFAGSAWYEKKDNVLIIKTDKAGEVSYSLSLPRFDYLKWPNLLENGSVKGINIY